MLAGLVRLVHVSRDLRELASFAMPKSRDTVPSPNDSNPVEIVSDSRNYVTRSEHVTRWKCSENGRLREGSCLAVSPSSAIDVGV